MKRIALVLLTLGMIGASPEHGHAQTPSALEVMTLHLNQQRAKDEHLKVRMVLRDKNGSTRNREISLYKKMNNEGTQMSLIFFEFPADVRGTGLLTHERRDGDDDQWLYLPSLGRERRIAGGSKSDNFVGTDFSYLDLNDEILKDYDYSIEATETIDDEECYKILALPRNETIKDKSSYAKRILWIAKKHHLAMRVQFFNKQGRHFKTFKASEIQIVPGTEKWRAHHMEMENLEKNHMTTLLLDNHVINRGLDDSFFSIRYLKR